MIELLMITLGVTQPPYPTVPDEWIYHQWNSLGENVTQELEFAREEDFSNPPARSWTPLVDLKDGKLGQSVYIQESGLICRRVKYFKDTIYQYLKLGCFYQTSNTSADPPKQTKNTPLYTLPLQIDFREEAQDPNPAVLGSSLGKENSVCNISLLGKEVANMICDLGITVHSLSYTRSNDIYVLEVNGRYKKNVTANVKIYECENFTFLKPSTWFGCNPVLKENIQKDLNFTYTVDIYPKEENFVPTSNLDHSTYSVRNIYTKDIHGKDAYVLVNIYSQFKKENWIDIECYKKLPIQIPKAKTLNLNTQPFVFPLNKIVGVTQWHGCTVYQCPHKGIDFGANQNKVVAIGDGKVIQAGWDSYGGKCFQGGNYIIIQHTNGMYSSYFHLKQFLVKNGSTVKKGEEIAISGNTGKWNCQNLGYHLHFELRKERKQDTHVNPVPYIAVDWNTVPTLSTISNPGRLSGENPHPNF